MVIILNYVQNVYSSLTGKHEIILRTTSCLFVCAKLFPDSYLFKCLSAIKCSESRVEGDTTIFFGGGGMGRVVHMFENKEQQSDSLHIFAHYCA